MRAADKFEILPADRSHAPLCAEIHVRCFPNPWSQTEFSTLLASPRNIGFIVQRSDRLAVGFAIAGQAGGEAEILTIGVLPEHRRCGAGRFILEKIRETCESHGTKEIFLEVNASDDGAVSFYQAAGYIPVGTRPGYYKHYRQTDKSTGDAIIMRFTIC